MLTGLANYLFGLNEFSDEVLENLFKETPIKGADGDDWILVELRQQQQLDSNEQSIGCPGDIEPGNGGGLNTSYKLADVEDKGQTSSTEDELTEDDKKSTNEEFVSEEINKQSTANNYPTIENNAESEEEEDEDEDEEDEEEDERDGDLIDSFTNNNDANNQKTANKRKKRKSRKESNNNPTGTMEGSWFMTPPPCFVSHKKSINKVSASPLEDILIEHPSISVFHSHTSSSLESFYPIPSQSSSSSPTNKTIGLPSSSQHSPCPTLHLLPSSGLRFADLTSLATVAVSSIVALATPPASSNRSNRSNRGQRNGSSSNNRNNNNNRLNDEATQPPRAEETRGANLENHERNGYLSEITNHHLAPMQKAMNQGSQKYLKKSFLNRQNLVKIQSNRRPTRRQRCTQRPSGYSNNRKMC